MRRETEFLLVAPKNIRPRLERRPRQDLVQIGNLVLPMVADQDKYRPLVLDDAPFNQRPDPVVQTLTDHLRVLHDRKFACLFFFAAAAAAAMVVVVLG